MDAQMKKGVLEALVLSAIGREESYGYKIISDLSGCIDICESTLYPILRRLEAGGFVTTRTGEYSGRLRKYFAITPSGRRRLREFLYELEELRRIADFIRSNGGAAL